MEEGELGGWEGSKGRPGSKGSPGSKERSGERMSSQRGKEWRGREEVGREEKRSQFKWEDSQACKKLLYIRIFTNSYYKSKHEY